MKQWIRLMVGLAALTGISGCGYVPSGGLLNSGALPVTPVMPPPGYLYEQVSAPLSFDFEPTAADAPRSGRATAKYFSVPFYPVLSFSWDDCSIETAAKAGGLQQVDYADYEVMNILGIYSEMTVIAHGR